MRSSSSREKAEAVSNLEEKDKVESSSLVLFLLLLGEPVARPSSSLALARALVSPTGEVAPKAWSWTSLEAI